MTHEKYCPCARYFPLGDGDLHFTSLLLRHASALDPHSLVERLIALPGTVLDESRLLRSWTPRLDDYPFPGLASSSNCPVNRKRTRPIFALTTPLRGIYPRNPYANQCAIGWRDNITISYEGPTDSASRFPTHSPQDAVVKPTLQACAKCQLSCGHPVTSLSRKWIHALHTLCGFAGAY